MPLAGFKPYRRKGGDIKAQPVTENMTIDELELVPGDYLVLDHKNTVTGAKKEDFEKDFEPVKKNYNKPKGKKAEGAAAAAAPAEAKA